MQYGLWASPPRLLNLTGPRGTPSSRSAISWDLRIISSDGGVTGAAAAADAGCGVGRACCVSAADALLECMFSASGSGRVCIDGLWLTAGSSSSSLADSIGDSGPHLGGGLSRFRFLPGDLSPLHRP